MKRIINKYDSENEHVTIRADDTVIGELKEIDIDSVAYVVQRLTEMHQIVLNKKLLKDE